MTASNQQTLREQYILWLLDRDPEFAAKLLGVKR